LRRRLRLRARIEVADGELDPEALRGRVGTELGVSDWVIIDQAMVDAHAATTGDEEWIHNDPDRARAEAPFGGPIAQGSLLLSNLVRMQEQVLAVAADTPFGYALNYGFDRVRFVRPVLVGSRVRGRFEVAEVRMREDGRVVIVLGVDIEVDDGDERPAVHAQWLGLLPPR
jgi:acyl dehydratase